MKKAFCSILFSAIILTSYAQVSQDTSNHLVFKGIPIDGPLDNFILKMKKSGFTYDGIKNGIAIFYGDFASYSTCTIGVSTLSTKDLVSKLVVLFPARDQWSSLSGNYFYLKEMLTTKYGRPLSCVEQFDRAPSDDNDKMHEIKLNRFTYLTIFETSKGTIKLAITHGNTKECFVSLAYFDKVNEEAIKEQALDDL